MTSGFSRREVLAGAALALPGATTARAQADRARVERIVGDAISPLMERHDIPGMGVAVTMPGARHAFSFGVASRGGGPPVTASTIFEIGSVSKAYTATLAGLAEARGALALGDQAGRHWPALAGSALERASLLDLGTYTAGGLPLQFPAEVTNEASMTAYLRRWRPDYPVGTRRRYSNPSIGLLGHLAARSLGRPFADLMERDLFPALGLRETFIRVPRERMGDYAFGTSRENRPIRVNPGMLADEAYGVRTTASDLARFMEANMDASALPAELQRATATTQHGYYRVGEMTQGLGWELYPHSMTLDRLLAGNAPQMAFEPQDAVRLDPPQSPRAAMLFNKTGSTNGFGAYAVFVPDSRIGIALLANRNYPNADRIKAAYRMLIALDA